MKQDNMHAQESIALVHILFWLSVLPFKAGDSQACVNHTRQLELIQPEILRTNSKIHKSIIFLKELVWKYGDFCDHMGL